MLGRPRPFAAVLLTAALAGACEKHGGEGDAGAPTTAAPGDSAAHAVSSAASDAAVAPVLEGDASAPNGFLFTDHPGPANIPNMPVFGDANGKALTIRTIVFEASTREWRVSFSDKALAKPSDFIGGQAVHIYLKDSLALGKKLTKGMKPGDGYFTIKSPDAKTPDGTTSWNSDNAFYLEITAWEIKAWDPKGPLMQEAGRASGRVYVAYKGGSRFTDSGISGTFENAIVRYNAKPFWIR